jgi:taurine transport system substrate-binding protein
MKMHKRQMLGVGLVALLASGSLFAQAKKEVTIAHQDMLVPFQALMDSGELEKATGYKINYRLFGGGGDVIKAMASGDVQLGQIGSSPLTAAASQGQDIKLFWILDDIADAEALIARSGSGVNTVKDLKGKKVATLCLDRPLPADGSHENGRPGRQLGQCDEHASARNCGGLGAWRY